MLVTTLITIITTAFITSVTTITICHFYFEKKIKHQLDDKIENSIEKLGDVVEEKVRQGIINGVASIPSREVLLDTTRTIAKTGADIVEEGLSTFFGKRTARKTEKPI